MESNLPGSAPRLVPPRRPRPRFVFLFPAEIRASQAMRRPSNILTGLGEGQCSACVCVNSSSLNTHMCKGPPPSLPFYPNMLTQTLPYAPFPFFTIAPELILRHIRLCESHRWDFTVIRSHYTGAIVRCRPLSKNTVEMTLL